MPRGIATTFCSEDEALVGQGRADQPSEHLGQAEAGDGGIDDRQHVVEDHAAVDIDLELIGAVAQPPSLDPPAGDEAQADAVVRQQVARGGRPRVAGEVVGGADDDEALRTAERGGDHVARDDLAEAQAAVAAAVERFGRIDVLVNNAGYGLLGAIEEGAADEVEALFRTNVFGLLAVTRAVLPQMRRQRSGHVLNVSSLGGYASSQGWGLYCATKFAIEGITEALAQELSPLGIHATVIEPGFFRTEFLAGGSLSRVRQEIADYAATVGAVRDFAHGHDGQQPGDPKQLAQVILKVVAADSPPVRVPIGADAFARVEAKNAAVAAELAQWREVAAIHGFAG